MRSLLLLALLTLAASARGQEQDVAAAPAARPASSVPSSYGNGSKDATPAAPAVMPQEVIDFMRTRGWGNHHIRWHLERNWKRYPPEMLQSYAAMGWSAAPRQEGDKGNGVEFLAMHRAMIQVLSKAFPRHRELFRGWRVPPTDGPGGPFEREMAEAVIRLSRDLRSFKSQDELGLYIETARGSTDPTAGVHNYLHWRYQDKQSAQNMGDPGRNIENPLFWKLHGWIDQRWEAYRKQAKPQDEGVSTYLAESAAHMDHPVPRGAPAPRTLQLPDSILDTLHNPASR